MRNIEAEIERLKAEIDVANRLAAGEVDRWINEIRKVGGCVRIKRRDRMCPTLVSWFCRLWRWLRRK
jgi:hypothetical protein